MDVGCWLEYPGFNIFGQSVIDNSMREEKNRGENISWYWNNY